MCKSLKDVYEKQQSEAAKHMSQEEKSMYKSVELLRSLCERKKGSVALGTKELGHL